MKGSALALKNPATNDTSMPATSCSEVCAIPLASIAVTAKRMREVNPDKVNELCRVFQVLGQLQPIGVKPIRDSSHYRLVFGFHRFLAKRKQAEEFGSAENTILAMVFPAEMPDWQCEAAEITENLIRAELSPDECAAHTTRYLALLKRYGDVVESNTARQANARNQHREEGHPNGLGHPLTATQQTCKDLGITDETVRNRVRKTRELAASVGVTTTNTTPEKMTADELETISQAARKAEEATGEIPQLEKRTGHNGKRQKRPARKSTPSPSTSPPPPKRSSYKDGVAWWDNATPETRTKLLDDRIGLAGLQAALPPSWGIKSLLGYRSATNVEGDILGVVQRSLALLNDTPPIAITAKDIEREIIRDLRELAAKLEGFELREIAVVPRVPAEANGRHRFRQDKAQSADANDNSDVAAARIKADVMLADGLPKPCRRTELVADADSDVEATAATTTRLQ